MRLWLLSFLGFWLLSAAWSIAAPYDGPPDEQMHALRAAAVVRGEFISEKDFRGAVQEVPSSLVRVWCFPQKVQVPANCAPAPGGDETLRKESTAAGRFNPVYYLVTGWPLAFWPNWVGILLTRLLTSAIVAALLASTVVAAARWTKHRAMVAGVVVAATPMLAHISGAITPQGPEIAAGAGLFAAMMALLHEKKPGDGVNRAAVALAGVSAAVLVTPRFTGIMWLCVILGVVLVPSSWARMRELWQSATVKRWSIFVAVATVASLAWTVLVKPADPTGYDHGFSLSYMVRTVIVDIWPNTANQMVGVMGWAETLMPRLIYVAWFMAVGLLLLGGLVLGNRVEKWRVLALFFGTFAPLIVLELLSANQIGWFNQGRYFLPGAVALPMLGAWIMAQRVLNAEQMRSVTRMLAVLLLPIHIVCLAYTMTRWQSGLASINPLKGVWMPPLGPVLPLVLVTVAVGVLLLAYWQASRTPTAVEPEPVVESDKEPINAARG